MQRLICICILLLTLFPGAAYAQDTRAQEEKKAKLEKEIAIIDKQLAANASKSSSMLADLTLIRKKISNRKALVKESDRQIRMYSDSIYLSQRKINRLQVKIDTLTSHYARLVRSAYKNRDSRIWFMYMLASDNLGQAFRRFGYFKNLSDRMKDEALQIRQMQDDLRKKKERLTQMKKEEETVKKERLAELNLLQKDEAKADKVVKNLNKDKRRYQNQLKDKKKEINALNREIARIIAEAMKNDEYRKREASRPANVKMDTQFANNKGKLPWPAEGPILGRFGKQYHPVFKNLELPQNNGIDIAVLAGSKICAVFDGVVSQVITIPGHNKCVLIQHGNYFTLYCKLKSVSVKVGQKVKTGDSLGNIDTINGQTQLHFEVWKEKIPQNPENWLR